MVFLQCILLDHFNHHWYSFTLPVRSDDWRPRGHGVSGFQAFLPSQLKFRPAGDGWWCLHLLFALEQPWQRSALLILLVVARTFGALN